MDRGGLVDYACTCRLGFSGPLCLTPRDNACLSTPCRNGGTCDLLTLTEYKCRCPPGWSGEGGSGHSQTLVCLCIWARLWGWVIATLGSPCPSPAPEVVLLQGPHSSLSLHQEL